MRRRAVATRKLRRIAVGDRVSLVFENRDTILFQLQEAMRDEASRPRGAADGVRGLRGPVAGPPRAQRHHVDRSVRNGSAAAELKALAGICQVTALVIDGEEVLANVDPRETIEDMASLTCYVRFELSAEQRARSATWRAP